eukprot:CAMPEP_0119314132 /NCGR_PEP_ID=MMETSP1333-20130426/31797_1 /TAXON_ID=418940 /ORGANISM="Scyphosphaera apsteinii, Strain RCC1455" /LENGTH=176 /DNA_ID=CAMNT_0007319185 /DNA_START=212 /DNA_END=740 /DNA_ORIENTATION=+
MIPLSSATKHHLCDCLVVDAGPWLPAAQSSRSKPKLARLRCEIHLAWLGWFRPFEAKHQMRTVGGEGAGVALRATNPVPMAMLVLEAKELGPIIAHNRRSVGGNGVVEEVPWLCYVSVSPVVPSDMSRIKAFGLVRSRTAAAVRLKLQGKRRSDSEQDICTLNVSDCAALRLRWRD